MKIAVGSDHGGFDLKTHIISFLKKRNIEIVDVGNTGPDSVDYPDYAQKVAQKIVSHEVDLGILFCGTGIGMCITANKIHGIRAAVVSEAFSAKMSREHNNANILCLGGRVVSPEKAEEIVSAWLDASFEGGRHQRRLDKISAIEQ